MAPHSSPGLMKRRLPHGQFRESPVPLATFHEACVPVVSLRSTTGSWLTFLRDGRDRVAPPLWFRLRRAVRLTSRMFARCASFRWPEILCTPKGLHITAQGRDARAHPRKMAAPQPNPEGQRREGFLRDHVRQAAHTFPAPSPPRSTCLVPCACCGGEGWGEGAISLAQAPSPRPSPPSGVHSASGIECGGEGAEPWETPRGNPSRRGLKG